jgi:hypothetical protein
MSKNRSIATRLSDAEKMIFNTIVISNTITAFITKILKKSF